MVLTTYRICFLLLKMGTKTLSPSLFFYDDLFYYHSTFMQCQPSKPLLFPWAAWPFNSVTAEAVIGSCVGDR